MLAGLVVLALDLRHVCRKIRQLRRRIFRGHQNGASVLRYMREDLPVKFCITSLSGDSCLSPGNKH